MRKRFPIAFLTLLAMLLAAGSVSVVQAADPHAAQAQCADGQDNDGDGLIDATGDHPDPDCDSPEDDSEAPEHAVEPSCFALADGGAAGTTGSGRTTIDLLTAVDPDDADPATNETTIGETGSRNGESLAFQPETDALFTVDGGQLGTLDQATGAFTATSDPVGSGPGAEGDQDFDNIDGLTFDPHSGTLYGSQRRDDDPDLLIVIDPATGAHVADAFGAGVDYVVVAPVDNLTDIDDLAVAEGVLYGLADEDGKNERLVTIDPATGATTDIGATGLDDIEGLTFAGDGRLLGTVGEIGATGEALVDIDPATGVAGNARALDDGRDYEGVACKHARRPATIAGFKFNDADGDGTWDGADHGEAGVEHVEIHLFNADGVHEHARTDAHGNYSFTVEPGTYTVCETVPADQTQTFPKEGADCSGHAPDEGTIGPKGYEVTVAAGEEKPHIDFGNLGKRCEAPEFTVPPCNVTGTKYNDLNGNGALDEGEPTLAGAEIHILAADGTDAKDPVTTVENGRYGFLVPPGTYAVCEKVMADYPVQTSPSEGADCTQFGDDYAPFGYEITVVDKPIEDLDFLDVALCQIRGLLNAIGLSEDTSTLAYQILGTLNDNGPVSGIVHSVDEAVPSPIGEGVHEVGCVVATVGL